MAEGTIWKITKPVAEDILIDLPLNSTLLYAGDQEGVGAWLNFWFFVPDVNTPSTESRRFHVVGTGHPIDEQHWCPGDYWTSVITAGGKLVWHIFKVGKG